MIQNHANDFGGSQIMYLNSICLLYMCALCHSSHVQLCATPWTVAHQDSQSMQFPRQEYWNELLVSSPGDLSMQGSNPHLLCLLHWQVDSSPLHNLGSPNMPSNDIWASPENKAGCNLLLSIFWLLFNSFSPFRFSAELWYPCRYQPHW